MVHDRVVIDIGVIGYDCTMKNIICPSCGQPIRQQLGTPKRFRDGQTAVQWLRRYMTNEGPAVDSVELREAGKRNGISYQTLLRARRQLNIDIEERHAFGARTTRWVVVPPPF